MTNKNGTELSFIFIFIVYILYCYIIFKYYFSRQFHFLSYIFHIYIQYTYLSYLYTLYVYISFICMDSTFCFLKKPNYKKKKKATSNLIFSSTFHNLKEKEIEPAHSLIIEISKLQVLPPLMKSIYSQSNLTGFFESLPKLFVSLSTYDMPLPLSTKALGQDLSFTIYSQPCNRLT